MKTSFIFLTAFSTFHSVCVCVCARARARARMSALSPVRLFVTPWIIAFKASQSMEFSRQEYWSRLPFPTPGDRPDPGIKPTFLASPALAGGFFTIAPLGKPSILLWKLLWKRFSLKARSIYFGCIRVSGTVCTQHFCYDYGFLNSVQVMDYWFISFLLVFLGVNNGFIILVYYCLLLLLLLLSRFSHVRLCATPETAAHQAPPSLAFSRQEHWSGLPFLLQCTESEKWKWSRSAVLDS